jgi:hypothetical protein
MRNCRFSRKHEGSADVAASNCPLSMTSTPENPTAPRGQIEPSNKRGTRRIPRPRFRSRGGLALLVLVTLSALGHVIASLLRSTIVFLPDEYLYSELSRSFSSSGLPLVRGSWVSFPSLLQPIVTAPCWRLGSVETGFHASMVLGSVFMSLAALPVYWLGRRLGLSACFALAASALALATPSMLYSSWLIGEAIAYPLFLTGFSMGVLALSGDKRWLIPALVVFALASLARVQMLVLPLAFAIATVLMAARERRVRRFLSDRRYLIGSGVLVAIVAVVVSANAFGFYSGVRHIDLVPGRFVAHLGAQALGILFASSWIIVPGALIGLGLAIFQPRSRVELGFACSASVVTLGLLLQASIFGDVKIPQERYVFYCTPILALSLALLIDRGWPLRRAHGLLVLPILVLSAVLPLSTYTASGRFHQSSFLYATFRLEQSFGTGNGALLVAVVVSVLALATLAFSFAGRLGGTGIFVLAIALSTTVLAISIDSELNNGARIIRQEAPKGWVDKQIDASQASGGQAVLLQGYGARDSSLDLLFWNRTVDRVALLPDSRRPDILPWPDLKIGGNGALSIKGKPLTGPVVIDDENHTIDLRGAIKAGRSTTFALWLPRGRPRFALYAFGFSSGWISPRAALTLWPTRTGGRLAGFLSFHATAARGIGPITLALSLPGAAERYVPLKVGESRSVRIAVCSNGPWRAKIAETSGRFIFAGPRPVSAHASAPIWRKDAAACAGVH